jgi:hypothetical protein
MIWLAKRQSGFSSVSVVIFPRSEPSQPNFTDSTPRWLGLHSACVLARRVKTARPMPDFRPTDRTVDQKTGLPEEPTRPAAPPLRSPHPPLSSVSKVSLLGRIDWRETRKLKRRTATGHPGTDRQRQTHPPAATTCPPPSVSCRPRPAQIGVSVRETHEMSLGKGLRR